MATHPISTNSDRRIVDSGTGWQEVAYGTPDEQIETPLVSVCVTAYRHEPYVRSCLESILEQQTNFPFEILVGEDNSPDGTREMCEQIAAAHPGRVRLMLHDRSNLIKIHGRPTGRFNFLHNLRYARGRYIALCEADDHWNDSAKLQKQVELLEAHPEFVYAFHNAIKIDENDKELGLALKPRFCQNRSPRDMLAGTWMPTASVMFRRIVADSLPEIFRTVYNGDTFMICHAGQFGGAGYVDVQPSAYRIHAGGIWSQTQEEFRLRSNLHTFETLFNEIPREHGRELGYQVVRKQNQLVWRLIRTGRLASASQQLSHNFAFCIPRMGLFWLVHQCRQFSSNLAALFRMRSGSPRPVSEVER